MFKASVIQLNSQDDVRGNLKVVTQLVAEAAIAESQIVLLPENFAFMGGKDTDKLQVAETSGSGLIQESIASLAQKHKIWILAGTIPIKSTLVKSTAEHKVYAASMLYDSTGAMVCR